MLIAEAIFEMAAQERNRESEKEVTEDEGQVGLEGRVSVLIRLARLIVNSCMLMTKSREESLIRFANCPADAGRTRRIACGMTTYRYVCAPVKPIARAESHCDFGMDSTPPRKISER